MLPPVASTLRANSGVAEIVGNRVYRHGEAVQLTEKPYITWSVISSIPYNRLSEVPTIDVISIDVNCWHQTDAGVEIMQSRVRAAMEPYCYMVNIIANQREPDTKLYRIGMQFDWHLPR
jgi:hypothetical protein